MPLSIVAIGYCTAAPAGILGLVHWPSDCAVSELDSVMVTVLALAPVLKNRKNDCEVDCAVENTAPSRRVGSARAGPQALKKKTVAAKLPLASQCSARWRRLGAPREPVAGSPRARL